LPPLLSIAARRTTWHQFAVNARPILLLAVALVFVTAAAVAAVASAVVPGLPLASAVVLGALVAPPDPVATSAVGAPLHLPRRMLADHLEGSGVLAVLVHSLYLSGRPDPDDVVGRLTFTTFWGVAEVAITGITFGVIGLELHAVLGTLDQTWTTLVWPTVLVVATVVVVRLLWLLPVAVLSRGRRRAEVEGPIGVRETLVMWWSGMRGVTTIVLALAIPLTAGDEEFPGRAQILLIAFAVVMVTLVLQGLTLPLLVRMLGVGGSGAAEEKAERALARRAAKAAIRRLDDVVESGDLPQAAAERLREKYVNLLAMLNPEMWDEEQRENAEQWRHRAGQLRAIDTQLLSAARQEIIDARSEPGIDPTVADRMLRRLDLQSMRGRR